ncbi:substrate-binding and vWA domain-containing protein [Kribbia dieselivorans]|uniref:substrate-binding and vWA domain-containing protein n=1 Tax=Kribbia dieselivorans TaxID=331526 RepID=UPI0008393C3C|nr:substrate-binding and VWA domain-containing protein [Kribbia dieselivorans]
MRRARALIAGLVFVAVTITGCSFGTTTGNSSGSGSGDAVVLKVMAGSEVKDLEPVLQRAKEVTGVEVAADYTGTLTGAEQIAAGQADGTYDAVWYSSNRYLSLLEGSSSRLSTQTKTMASPVVLGVRESVARKLGWDTKAPTWKDITTAVKNGSLTYGMTDPSASNSGFSALVGVATALSGGGAALTQKQVDAAAPQLREFFSGQKLTSGSSGWLADAYVNQQGTDRVDALINYESVILELNRGDRLTEKLHVVIPADGVVTADYPLTLLRSATQEKKDAYTRLTDWLRTPEAQQLIQEQTARRPVVPGVKLDSRFGTTDLIELPFPNRREVVDGLINAYMQDLRRPSQTVYVLDVSGSMNSRGRLDELKKAMSSLTGAQGQTSQGVDRFATFRARETVILMPFSSRPQTPQTFTIPTKGGEKVRGQIQAAIDGLTAQGDTSIFTSVEEAYRVLERSTVSSDQAFNSIVVLTDGQNTSGQSFGDLQAHYESMPNDLKAVPTFSIVFGASDRGELEQLADLTGGRVFDATSGDLTAAFREIRGYQ